LQQSFEIIGGAERPVDPAVDEVWVKVAVSTWRRPRAGTPRKLSCATVHLARTTTVSLAALRSWMSQCWGYPDLA
jgi:hypothetical protein